MICTECKGIGVTDGVDKCPVCHGHGEILSVADQRIIDAAFLWGKDNGFDLSSNERRCNCPWCKLNEAIVSHPEWGKK